MPNPTLRYRNDEGFAMAVVISVILVMFIMLAAVTLPLSADLSSSIRLGKVADERQLAESVMNELFSQAAKSSDLSAGFQMIGRVDPGVRSVDDAGDTAGWAKYVPTTGRFEACGAITDLCYFYSPQLTPLSPFVTVEVTTRSACRANKTSCVFRRFQQSWRRRSFVDYVIFTDMETLQPELYGSSPGLRVVRSGGGAPIFVDTTWAQQHCGDRFVDNGGPAASWPADLVGDSRNTFTDISRRQTNATSATSLRYLWPHRVGNAPLGAIDEDAAFQTVQPTDRRHENCFEIAYTKGSVGDQVNGPIHTNDYWFWYCGSPVFNDIVEATGDPAAGSVFDRVFKSSTNAGCTAPGSPQQSDLTPARAQLGKFLQLPAKLTTYMTLASTTLTPTVGNTVKVKLLPGGLPGQKRMLISLDSSVPTTDMPVPYRGVVYVPSSGVPSSPRVLEIEGEGSDVTFVSEDDLRVVGDIKQPTLEGVTLGFVAGGSITIDQTSKLDSPRKDRYVTGAFLSLRGMSVNGWNDVADASLPTHPTLNLTGAIIAKYRPVFGTYNAAGDLQTGMRKNIQYPKNLAGTEQLPPTPPYFVQPVNAVWVRLDFSETPLLAARPGLTKAPTSPPGTAAVPGSCQATWPTGDAATGYVPSCLVN